MILFFLYIISLWFVNAWHDSDYYNKVEQHLSGSIFACLSIIGWFIFPDVVKDWIDILNIALVALSLRWIVFDIS